MSASLDSDLTIAFVDISCIVFPFDNFMGDGWLTAGGLMSCGLLGIGSDLCTICSPVKRQRTPPSEDPLHLDKGLRQRRLNKIHVLHR